MKKSGIFITICIVFFLFGSLSAFGEQTQISSEAQHKQIMVDHKDIVNHAKAILNLLNAQGEKVDLKIVEKQIIKMENKIEAAKKKQKMVSHKPDKLHKEHYKIMDELHVQAQKEIEALKKVVAEFKVKPKKEPQKIQRHVEAIQKHILKAQKEHEKIYKK